MFKKNVLPIFKFHSKVLKRKEVGAMDYLENNSHIRTAPIFIILPFLILSLSVLQFAPKVSAIVMVLLALILMYHLTIVLIYNSKIQYREQKRREDYFRFCEEEKRKEKQRQTEEIFRRFYEEQRKAEQRIREEQYRREREFKEKYNNYSNERYNQQSNVDQNMINAMKLMGLQKGFTQKDLKSAYRRLSKIYHPDMGGSEVNFKKLNTAYNYVMDRI